MREKFLLSPKPVKIGIAEFELLTTIYAIGMTKLSLLLFICFFFWTTHNAVQSLLLALGLGITLSGPQAPYKMLEILTLGWPHARQVLYLLYYHYSSLSQACFKEIKM